MSKFFANLGRGPLLATAPCACRKVSSRGRIEMDVLRDVEVECVVAYEC